MNRKLLYLINPGNSSVSLVNVKANWLNRWRVWKPLGLLNIAALTPDDWDIEVLDENVRLPDYEQLPRPDLVGLTAFTSQAERAYQLSRFYRARDVPVIMGGIHASMCPEEASRYVDTVVIGEGERAWPQVLTDLALGELKPRYESEPADMAAIPHARHDLLHTDYVFGSVQTTRGCPLSCDFCSVSAFNGKRYRLRPVEDVIEEIKGIKEKYLLFVDDNLVGTSRQHVERAKQLFRGLIKSRVRKRWMAQVTINMADDDELLLLAAKSGCMGVFIGFETPTQEGLVELNKKFNSRGARDFRASSRRLQRRGLGVLASFIVGLDVDRPGIGARIAEAADAYGVDLLNLMFLTPLPGTRLWQQMEADGRIAANCFPEDWRHYTLNLPVARYMNLSWAELCREFVTAMRSFYTYPSILRRAFGKFLRSRSFVALCSELITGFMFRRNIDLDQLSFDRYDVSRGASFADSALVLASASAKPLAAPGLGAP